MLKFDCTSNFLRKLFRSYIDPSYDTQVVYAVSHSILTASQTEKVCKTIEVFKTNFPKGSF